MAFSRSSALDQALDIAGSLTQTSNLDIGDEVLGYGAPISGQSGATATLSVLLGGIVTITGLTGMTAQSAGRFITISGAATGANNGTFLISEYVSATSVKYVNASAVVPDANNGAISWTERAPYSLEDDLNYIRADRALIKGVAYYADVPTYTRCTDTLTAVPANLSNIAGKTTDAKSFVVNRKYNDATVSIGSTYYLMSDTGTLPYADSVNVTGVPINDGFDAGNDAATYVEIIADGYQSGLTVLSGIYDGYFIFGRTRQGGSGVDGNSVEIEFRACEVDGNISNSVAYTWEAGQPTVVDFFYGFRECLDSMSETALRTVMTNGLVADAALYQDINDIRTVIGINDNDTDLSGKLTNLTAYYAFSDLPDVTPTVVEALNTLNEQIGNRDYTGAILTDGYTITQSLQQLADAIGSASGMTRTIERLSADIPAGTAHTLPGGLTYTLDGTDNGRYMWVYWRGLLRDPGAVTAGNDYEEVSSTQIRPYSKIKNGDHINYFTS